MYSTVFRRLFRFTIGFASCWTSWSSNLAEVELDTLYITMSTEIWHSVQWIFSACRQTRADFITVTRCGNRT